MSHVPGVHITDVFLDYIHRHHVVRGWAPRRIYVTTQEMYEAMVAPETVGSYYASGSCHMFDGCVLRHLHRPDVVKAIRAWDLG